MSTKTDPTSTPVERIQATVGFLIQTEDPRRILTALLSNAAALGLAIMDAGRATPAQIAGVFSSALVDALTPQEAPKEESRIEVVPAGVNSYQLVRLE